MFPRRGPVGPAGLPVRALRSLLRGDARALVHRLPVDGDFTLAAGRGIWGFPKTLAEFDVDHSSATKHGRLVADGALRRRPEREAGDQGPRLHRRHRVARLLTTRRDHPDDALATHLDQWDPHPDRWRESDTRQHPIADELRSLRLGRHALMSSSVDRITMRFEDPTVV